MNKIPALKVGPNLGLNISQLSAKACAPSKIPRRRRCLRLLSGESSRTALQTHRDSLAEANSPLPARNSGIENRRLCPTLGAGGRWAEI
jgi:hypothetical protein